MKIILITILLFVFSCSHQKARDISAYASNEDQYWNDMAFESEGANSSIMGTLEERNLVLYNQILKDSEDPYLNMFWGMSLNFDSGAKKIIVDDKIMGELQGIFNIKNDNKIVHAGIAHTYGYLFSTINTPYGYKRKRWIDKSLNVAFGLENKGLSPYTFDGGLLSNVTYFSGMLAFKNTTELSLLKNVSNEVFTYDYAKLEISRVEEEIKDYTLVTTLVRFPVKLIDSENDYLLIYSTVNQLTARESLITAFPINTKSFERIIAEETLGTNKRITLRYNAYLDGVGNNFIGTRKIIRR